MDLAAWEEYYGVSFAAMITLLRAVIQTHQNHGNILSSRARVQSANIILIFVALLTTMILVFQFEYYVFI